MKKLVLVGILFAFLITIAPAIAQPSNDAHTDAINITSVTTSFNTTGAATTGWGSGQCLLGYNNQIWHDIWYNYTATGTGNLTVDTCAIDFDSVIAVYDGCDNSTMTMVSCSDDDCGIISGGSKLVIPVTEGNCYKIRVGGFGDNVTFPPSSTYNVTGAGDVRVTLPHTITAQSGMWFQLLNGVNVTTDAQIGIKDVYVKKTNGDVVGRITINFNNSFNNLTLPALTIDTNLVGGKTVLAGVVDSSIVTSHALLIPKTTGNYFVCDDTSIDTLAEVISGTCAGYNANPTGAEETIGGNVFFRTTTSNSGGGNGPSGVPEFSDFAWILAAVLGAGGFILIRKKGL